MENKPTREEVLEIKHMLTHEGFSALTRTEIHELIDAYLSQEEELEAARNALLKEGIKVGELEAENRVLRCNLKRKPIDKEAKLMWTIWIAVTIISLLLLRYGG